MFCFHFSSVFSSYHVVKLFQCFPWYRSFFCHVLLSFLVSVFFLSCRQIVSVFSKVLLVFLSCFALISRQCFLPIMSSNCFSVFQGIARFSVMFCSHFSSVFSSYHVVKLFQCFPWYCSVSVMFCCILSSALYSFFFCRQIVCFSKVLLIFLSCFVLVSPQFCPNFLLVKVFWFKYYSLFKGHL